MTSTLIRASKDLVKHTRNEMGLTLEAFGELLGVTKQMIQMVETGQRTLDLERIGAGLVHPTPNIRSFWLDYFAVRQRELQAAMIENASKMAVEHV